MSAPTAPPDTAPASAPAPWYRRRAGFVTLAVLAILAVTVITDLPAPDSRAADIAAARTIIGQINTDVAPCTNAASEAFQLYGFQTSGTITGDERANAFQWLSQDIVACSLVNAQVFDLSNLDVPGTPSGHQLAQLLSWATLWTTSDAHDALNTIQHLMSAPRDATAAAALQAEWDQLAEHRLDARRCVATASALLSTSLPVVGLPSIPRPAAT